LSTNSTLWLPFVTLHQSTYSKGDVYITCPWYVGSSCAGDILYITASS